MGNFEWTTTSCERGGPPSCRNTTIQPDLCCFEAPGGLLAQTQFWDTNPVTGPDDSWTIHGLWPDKCDLTYEQSCDPSRAYSNIEGLLIDGGQQSLVSYMNTYWVSNNESPEAFWEHEWATHGTCYSTLQPGCFANYKEGDEAVIFFARAVSLFQSLPTYDWLASAGITPSRTETYSLSTLIDALSQASGGYTPSLHCSRGSLSQIYWYFNLKGSLVDGTFVPISAPEHGNCPHNHIRYLPKTNRG